LAQAPGSRRQQHQGFRPKLGHTLKDDGSFEG